MSYQVILKRKDGTFRTNLGVALDQVPSVGGEISYLDNDQIITAKVTAIRETSVGADIGQPLNIVDADEI